MTNQWLPISFLPLSRLRLKWQAHLLHFMAARIGDLKSIIKAGQEHECSVFAHSINTCQYNAFQIAYIHGSQFLFSPYTRFFAGL